MPTASSRALLHSLQSSLQSFLSSKSTFQIIRSATTQGLEAPTNPRTLFILDSSFNPPTNAHLTLALSALKGSPNKYPAPHRLLLLFAVQNADKNPGPAPFEHRLAMMTLLAEDITRQTPATVDVGLTTLPYYTDKSAAIETSAVYGDSPAHVHLIGYDTLVRMFAPKYYPDHKPPLSALTPYFDKHRLRVTIRPDDGTSKEEQLVFTARLAEGGMETDGGRREWAAHIEMVDENAQSIGVSSTAVRTAIKHQNWSSVRNLVCDDVQRWIHDHELYRE